MTTFGVHTGLQSTTVDDLRAVWRHVEALGFGWISVWDHFYAATGRKDDPECLEAVAMHAALALETRHVRVGSLVYSVGYRHPAVLAKAITAIDHLSGGRADMGIGAGWAQVEYDAYGIEFPPIGVRMDQLEEGVQCLRGLLHHERTTFDGRWFRLDDAANAPRPVQAHLPIWVGGTGEQRTLRIAARHADGWNAAYIAPEVFAAKRAVLVQRCEEVGRDPGEIACAVNVGLAWTEESLVSQYGELVPRVRGGVLGGSDEQVLDAIGRYVEAGADQVNLVQRPPFSHDDLSRFAAALRLAPRA